MRKIVALLLALCLLCAAGTAAAETAARAITLDFGEFSLALNGGEYYQRGDKAANQPVVVVYPYFSVGDPSSNYSFIWSGEPFEATADSVTAQVPDIEQTIRDQLAESQIEVTSFTLDEPYDATLNGVECVVLDMVIEMSAFGMSVTVYEREIMMGTIGYIINIAAATPEGLDDITGLMAESLEIK